MDLIGANAKAAVKQAGRSRLSNRASRAALARSPSANQKRAARKNGKVARAGSLRSSWRWNNNKKGSAKKGQVYVRDGAAVGDDLCLGDFTREVYNAICVRLGDTLHIPEDSVQALFNDMHLYPSKSQVSKMLQCARQCGRRNGAADHYITFGEFCIFVREMQSQSPKQQRRTSATKVNANKCPSRFDVFLGGSCNPTTWRADIAIPELQKNGITFYNPQVSTWAPELVAQEHDAKQAASVLLFVIDSQTRSTVGMTEVAYLVASGRCVVVVAQPYKQGQAIMGEVITDREYLDLVASQKSLLDLVKGKGVKIHTSLPTALQCTANILRNSTSNGTSAEEQITYKLRKLREVYDLYGGDMRLYQVPEAYQKLTNRSLEIGRLYGYVSKASNSPITFERFCALMAEFSTTDGCDMCTTDGRTLYWKCALLRARSALRTLLDSALVWASQPFQRQRSANDSNGNLTDASCLVDSGFSEPGDDDDDLDGDVEVFLGGSQRRSRDAKVDIYLGGSLSPSTANWRTDVAIPLIKKHGLIYYNPALRESEGDVLEWKRQMDGSATLLFVIGSDARSMTTMILAAHSVGLDRDVVLCVQNLPSEGCVVGDETLTKNAVKDYNRARVYLRDLCQRKQVPVFDSVSEAVECSIQRRLNGTSR